MMVLRFLLTLVLWLSIGSNIGLHAADVHSGATVSPNPSSFLHRELQGLPVLPPGLVAPEVLTTFSVIEIIIASLAPYESPIAIRLTSYLSVVFWNAAAVFSTDFRDILTKKRPAVTVPHEDRHTTEHRFPAGMQAIVSYCSLSLPGAVEPLIQELTNQGYTGMDRTLDITVAACPDVFCLQLIADNSDYDPIIMGHIIAKQTYDASVKDGFNQLGTDNGLCINVNCRPYQDSIGYSTSTKDRNKSSRRRTKGKGAGKGKDSSRDDEDEDDSWQPLLEDDGFGFFSRHEHVLPHIGETAEFFNLPEEDRENRRAAPPTYSKSRYEEAHQVLQTMATTLRNETNRMAIEVFNDKLRVARGTVGGFVRKIITEALFTSDGWVEPVASLVDPRGAVLSWERLVHFASGHDGMEYDAVVIAWKEKINYDLIRPTSIIQSWGDEPITTWAAGGVQTFPARNFDAYIRVMPHSEYVSGSACIFQGLEEYVLGYLEDLLGFTDTSFPVEYLVPAGTSVVEPRLSPQQDVLLQYPTIEAAAEAGSQSRLHGGMHFAESVPAARELCRGIGTAAVTAVGSVLYKQGESERNV